MIKPTVGRKVHYWPTKFDPGPTDTRNLPGAQPYDATICFAHSDRCVNLSISDHNGRQFSLTSVELVQSNSPVDFAKQIEGGFAEWPKLIEGGSQDQRSPKKVEGGHAQAAEQQAQDKAAETEEHHKRASKS